MFAIAARIYQHTYTQEQTETLMCMPSLINMYFRGVFLFVENESIVGEFFLLIGLADFILLYPVAGAGFLLQSLV